MADDYTDSGRAVARARQEPKLPATAKPPHPLDKEWFINMDDETFGPYSGHELKEFADEGRLERHTQVVKAGGDTWVDASKEPTLKRFFAPAMPVRPDAAPSMGPASAKDNGTVVQVTNNIQQPRAAAILEPGANKSPGLALFLSLIFVGLGQIYNGDVGKGILMFIGCVLLWAVFLGWIINLWSMIDAYSKAKELRTKYDLWLANAAAR